MTFMINYLFSLSQIIQSIHFKFFLHDLHINSYIPTDGFPNIVSFFKVIIAKTYKNVKFQKNPDQI